MMSDGKTAAISAYLTAQSGTTAAIPALMERLPIETRLDVCANIIKGLHSGLHSHSAESKIREQVIADIPPKDENIFDFEAWQEFIDKHKVEIDKIFF